MSTKTENLRMPDVNEIRLAGRLTRDPELKYTAGDVALCKLGMAINKKYKTKAGEQREETLFINVTVWGKSAEWCGEHLRVGYPVLVSGRLTQNEWVAPGTGEKRSTIEVNADRVQCLRWESNGQQSGDYEPAPGQRPQAEEPIPEDEIPF